MKEILFISPYPALAALGKRVVGKNNDIDFKNIRMDEAAQYTLEAEKKGYQVVISRGITA